MKSMEDKPKCFGGHWNCEKQPMCKFSVCCEFQADNISQEALTTFGSERQLLQLVEEMAELTKAIIKFVNRGGDIKRLAEEVADVENVLQQIKLFLQGRDIDYSECQAKSARRLREAIERETLRQQKDSTDTAV